MLFGNKNILLFICAAIILAGLSNSEIAVTAAERVQTTGDEIVIVIDPGHGGSNQGTQAGHTIEKYMTMVTAWAMYHELLQYDNVKVYMTHTDDRDMSLEERAEFAAGVGADFLFSIHYNASENHNKFGSEVWISCEKPYNAYGYQFGCLHLRAMAEKGLFIRGVKNRQNDKKTDYYGIIREAAMRSVPAVIIEHCHVDEERDANFIRNEEDFAQFGRADALSVAKYFGLKSTSLGVDYSEEAGKLEPASADSLIQRTLWDATCPNVCEIEMSECDYDTGEVSITVRGADYDSPLIYYDYSIDNGKNWSRLESWPGSNMLTGEYADAFQLNLMIPVDSQSDIMVRAYNKDDQFKQSNVLQLGQAITQQEAGDTAPEPLEHTNEFIRTVPVMPVEHEREESDEKVGIMTFLKCCLLFAILLFIIILNRTGNQNYGRKRNNRGKDEKDARE